MERVRLIRNFFPCDLSAFPKGVTYLQQEQNEIVRKKDWPTLPHPVAPFGDFLVPFAQGASTGRFCLYDWPIRAITRTAVSDPPPKPCRNRRIFEKAKPCRNRDEPASKPSETTARNQAPKPPKPLAIGRGELVAPSRAASRSEPTARGSGCAPLALRYAGPLDPRAIRSRLRQTGYRHAHMREPCRKTGQEVPARIRSSSTKNLDAQRCGSMDQGNAT
jgi:hypothetical protein